MYEEQRELNPYYGEISEDEFDRIVEAFNNVGEVYPISAKDLKKALERY